MINFRIKENKNRIFLILLILLLFSSWFYWFQYRPSEVRKSCAGEATRDIKIKRIENDRYRECLVKHGFKPESLFEETKTQPVTNEPNTNQIEGKIDDLKYSLQDSLEEQKQQIQDEFQNSANCESNGGKYQGNGLCTYF